MMENDERREGFGELRADVKNMVSGFNEFKGEFREFKRDVYGKLNQNSQDIAAAKGVGKMLHVFWTATVGSIVAYLWSSHK